MSTLEELLLSIATGGPQTPRVHRGAGMVEGPPARTRAAVRAEVEVESRPGEHPGLWEELQTTIARLSKSPGSGSSGAQSAETPILFHARASAVAAQLGNEVVTWARLIAEENPGLELTATTVPEAARWIARWLTVFPSLVEDYGAEMLVGIGRWVRKAEWVIDHGPERIFAGRCETPLTEEGRAKVQKDPDADVERCMADLYARKDKGFISCRECGAIHDVAYRKEWLSKHLASSLVTAAEAAPFLSWKLGKDIKVDTIHKWRLRGRLVERGQREGRPLYRFSEVEALAIEVKIRESKAKAKKEGSAA